jgi:nitrite reductase (NADH) large subunit
MPVYLIIGSGPSGIAAAEAIRLQDPDGEIVIIGDEPQGYYSRPGLAYYLTGELAEENLYPFTERDFERLNLRRIQGTATQIMPQAHRVRLASGVVLPYDRLLIATGATANRLSIPGAGLEGVVKLDNLNDAASILAQARRTRSAVVVGGGITALEIVEGLASRRTSTHYFLRGGRYWSSVLDETESRIVERRLVQEGVQVHFNTEVEAILGRKGRVAGVYTKEGRQYKCEMVAVAIGIRPRKELADACGLKVDRGILVGSNMQTSAVDIFAAGDVAQVFDPFSGKFVLDSLWGPARDQGTIAGLNMAGQRAVYQRSVPFNATRLANLTTTIIGTIGQGADGDLLGIARGDSETWRSLPDAISAQSDFEVNRLRILVASKRLVGALVMGDQTLSRPLHHIIAHQVDITPIRDRLLRPGAPIADILADFWAHIKREEYAAQ